MRIKLLVAALTAVALAGCGLLTQPSDVTSFTLKSMSPAPGSVLTTGTTIIISGDLSVERRVYFTMLFVRDDGAVFMAGVGGGGGSWSDYRFQQGVGTASQDASVFAGVFCRTGSTITRAVVATSSTDLAQYYLNDPGFLVYKNFDWGLIGYQKDIPLNYRCQ